VKPAGGLVAKPLNQYPEEGEKNDVSKKLWSAFIRPSQLWSQFVRSKELQPSWSSELWTSHYDDESWPLHGFSYRSKP